MSNAHTNDHPIYKERCKEGKAVADDKLNISQSLLEKLQAFSEPQMLIEAYLSEARRAEQKKPEDRTRKILGTSHQEVEADFYINIESFGPMPEETGLSKEILESREGKWFTADVVLSTKSEGKGGTASSSSTSTPARRKAASRSSAGRQAPSPPSNVQTPLSKRARKK
jgi:hypothetical protein